MDQAEWQIGIPTGNLGGSYRGIRIIIKRSTTGDATQICWFIGGVVAQTLGVDCDLDAAKKCGMEVIDQNISMNVRWQRAEEEEQRAELRTPQQRVVKSIALDGTDVEGDTYSLRDRLEAQEQSK